MFPVEGQAALFIPGALRYPALLGKDRKTDLNVREK